MRRVQNVDTAAVAPASCTTLHFVFEMRHLDVQKVSGTEFMGYRLDQHPSYREGALAKPKVDE